MPIQNENHITEEMIEDAESVLTLQPGHITSSGPTPIPQRLSKNEQPRKVEVITSLAGKISKPDHLEDSASRNKHFLLISKAGTVKQKTDSGEQILHKALNEHRRRLREEIQTVKRELTLL